MAGIAAYAVRNECGFGDNTWEYATYVWTMLKHYIGNGAESYMYWNLILAPWGVSTWGDPQNAMVTVQNGDYTLNPDFYVMKHFSNAYNAVPCDWVQLDIGRQMH